MDTRTGEIVPLSSLTGMSEEERSHFIEMQIPPTMVQLARMPHRVARNESCPCGSGKKLKHCCWGKRRQGKWLFAGQNEESA